MGVTATTISTSVLQEIYTLKKKVFTSYSDEDSQNFYVENDRPFITTRRTHDTQNT